MSTLLVSPLLNPAPQPTAAQDILAATAHELRLPLSLIKGFVSSLQRTDVEWDDETRAEFIAEIELEADRLTEIVESLLERGPLQVPNKPGRDMALIPPTAVAQGALHRMRGLLDGRAVRLDVPQALPAVRMDASQMERVLGNLIQNAIKYSPAGTPIGISARMTADAELELCVDDEGPGIPAEDRERIFESFFRKRSEPQLKVPGHGLGLATRARSLSSRHIKAQPSTQSGTPRPVPMRA